MDVLIFEDDAEKREWFLKDPTDPLPVFTATAQETIDQLRKNKWDALLLTYDNGGELLMDKDDPRTGLFVAKWLKKNPRHMPKRIILHGINTEGNALIMKLFPKAYEQSYAWMSPLCMIVEEQKRDNFSAPLYEPVED